MEPDAVFSKLSSVAEKIEYVVLETNDECLIGSTKNIQVTADGYLIAYRDVIYHFGKNGEFLSKIDHIGKGPGEYLTILPHYIHNPEGVLASDDDDTTWLVRDAENAIPYLVVDPFVNKSEDKIYVSPINYLNHNYLGFDGREYGIYSLKEDQYYVVNGRDKRKLDDDIDFGLPVQLYHSIEGKVYSMMDAIDLLKPDNPNFNPEKRLADLIKGLHENDNPVLRIVTLRDKFIVL
jgi:hypothetical protein